MEQNRSLPPDCDQIFQRAQAAAGERSLPVRRASQRRWQLGAEVALRRIHLGLCEIEAAGEVGSAQIGASQVSAHEVGQTEVGASEVSSDEVRPSQVGALEVRASEVLPDEVGAAAVDLTMPGIASHQFARTKQQGINGASVRREVKFHEVVGTAVREAFGLIEREAQLAVERTGRLQRQRFRQIPEELVEVPHDSEHLEHLACDSWSPPPVLAAERDLSNLLPGTKAVIDGAAGKAALPQDVVNRAAEVRLQIWAGLPRVLVDGEVR